MTTTPNDDTDRIVTTYWMTWDDAVTLHDALHDDSPARFALADYLDLASPHGPVTSDELARVEIVVSTDDASILDAIHANHTPHRVHHTPLP